MRVLLDTHVFLWWRGDPDRIEPSAREAIAEADVVFVSVVSAWEAAIKISLGKLDLSAPFEAGVMESSSMSGRRSYSLPRRVRMMDSDSITESILRFISDPKPASAKLTSYSADTT